MCSHMSFYCSKGSTWLHPWLLCRQCHRLDDASRSVSINRALRFFEQHPPKQNMALAWCSSLASSRAPDMSSFSHIADARRVCASNKDSFLCPDLYSCSFKYPCPWHLVPVGTRMEETSRKRPSWSRHAPGYSNMGILSQRVTCQVCWSDPIATYQGEMEDSLSRCKKRTCEALVVICLLPFDTLPSGYEYSYSQVGNNKF